MMVLRSKEKIDFMSKTITVLEGIVKSYQKENRYLIELLAGGRGKEILIEAPSFSEVDNEEFLAGTIMSDGEGLENGND